MTSPPAPHASYWRMWGLPVAAAVTGGGADASGFQAVTSTSPGWTLFWSTLTTIALTLWVIVFGVARHGTDGTLRRRPDGHQ